VSSLDASLVSAERFLVLVCGHWQVESRLHLMKDRWWDEDIHVLFRPGLGEIWSSLTSLAVSLLWWGREGKVPTETSKGGGTSTATISEKHGILKTCSRTRRRGIASEKNRV